MMKYFLALITLYCVLLTGCSRMLAERISTYTPEPHGVLVQVPSPHQVLAVLPIDKETFAFRQASVTIPSREEVYDFDFRGGLFSSSKLVLDVNSNGTVKKLRFERVDAGSESLTNTAGALTAITAKQKELEPNPPAQVNAIDEENAELQRQLLNLMLQANVEAAETGQPLPFPDMGL